MNKKKINPFDLGQVAKAMKQPDKEKIKHLTNRNKKKDSRIRELEEALSKFVNTNWQSENWNDYRIAIERLKQLLNNH